MLGLDTSVVLRLLVGKPEAQAKIAQAALEKAFASGEEVVVSDLVVAEAYFALHYHYAISKDAARNLLRKMVNSGVMRLDPEASLPALEAADGAGLVDRLILQRYRGMNAKTVTFDRALAAAGAFKIT